MEFLVPKNAKICNVTFEHRQWQILVTESALGVKNNHGKVVERSLNSSKNAEEHCISAAAAAAAGKK